MAKRQYFILALGFPLIMNPLKARALSILSEPSYYNGHTYFLLSQSNWSSAEDASIVFGGHLATINNQDENGWILKTFSNWGGESRNLWIGLSDPNGTGSFTWVDGETSAYRNWAPSEPNFDGVEKYTYILPSEFSTLGLWNNHEDTDSAKYTTNMIYGPYNNYGVMEIDSLVTSVPAPLSVFGGLGIFATYFMIKKTKFGIHLK